MPKKKSKKQAQGKLQGFVKWFDYKKGYGFISIEEQDDVFVHFSNIIMNGFKKLDMGDLVEFELKNNSDKDSRPEAINVKVLVKDKRY
ncbi:MAG: cold shock domain-containing protein [Promethearchaeota archaeon]